MGCIFMDGILFFYGAVLFLFLAWSKCHFHQYLIFIISGIITLNIFNDCVSVSVLDS